MHAIQWSTARKKLNVNNLRIAEPTRKEPNKEDFLNKMVNYVVWEERTSSGGHAAKEEVSETVNGANVLENVASILYHIEGTLTALVTLGPDNAKPYGGSRMAAMLQAMFEKAVSEKSN